MNVTNIYRAWRVRFRNYIYVPCTIYVLSKKEYCDLEIICLCYDAYYIFYLHVETKILEGGMSLNSLTLCLSKKCMYSKFEKVCFLCIKTTVIQDNNMNLIEIQIPNVRKAGATYTHQGAWNFVQLELSIQIICIV